MLDISLSAHLVKRKIVTPSLLIWIVQPIMLRKIAIGLIVVLLLALVLIYFLSPDEEPVEEPIVPEPTTTRLTTEGEYIGFLDANGSRAWLGLPFAAPPIEKLRWVKPNRPEPHSGIKQAIAFKDPCVQFSNPTLREHDETVVGVVGNEDCLYLNIWSPPNTIDAPVMFWIHGGGNSVGEAGTYKRIRDRRYAQTRGRYHELSSRPPWLVQSP